MQKQEQTDIHRVEKISLRSGGEKDPTNTQIFTPRFIVDQMIEAIGKKNICNLDYNILEPTSGDGAFTVRILETRLENCLKEFKKSKDFKGLVKNGLKSVSTLYSIEMDEAMIKEQRDNVYTAFCSFFEKHKKVIGNELPEIVLSSVKQIISKNFVWGKTNVDDGLFFNMTISDAPNDGSAIVGYKMPDDSERETKVIRFYSWTINDDYSVIGKEEEVEA